MKIFGFEIGKKQSSFSQPEQWLVEAILGAPALSGINVTPQASMRLSAVFACVRVLMEDIAALPLNTYERDAGARRKATEHPVYSLLHDAPNPEMTAFAFREAMMADLALTRGNGYAEIERDGRGRVVNLWYVPSYLVVPRRNPTTRAIEYQVTVPNSGQIVIVPGEKMLHIPALTFDGIMGQTPVNIAKDVFGLSMAIDTWANKYFANGGHVKDALEHPGKLGEEGRKNLRQSWEESHGSLTQAQRIAVLEEGLKYSAIVVDLTKTMPTEVRTHQVAEIARLFRMPLHKIMQMDRATWGNTEQMAIEYVTGCLTPWAVRWEQNLALQLLRPDERGRYYFKLELDSLLRGDALTRYRCYATGRQWGWLSVNNIREKEDMDPIEGGDIYLQPANMTEAGDTLNATKPEPGDNMPPPKENLP